MQEECSRRKRHIVVLQGHLKTQCTLTGRQPLSSAYLPAAQAMQEEIVIEGSGHTVVRHSINR